jgi:integrase/recombinase XerD
MREEIRQFLAYISEHKGYSENTFAAYRNDLSQFVSYLEGKATSWEDIDRDILLGYIMFMKSEQEYASSTVARKVAAIKSFFHYLVESGQLQDDPTAALDSPKVRKRLPKAISPDDMERLLSEPTREQTPKALRDRALLELLYATGLRVTELVSLNVEDVSVASSTVRVMRRRGQQERIIPIHERAIGPTQDYLERGRVQLLRDPEVTALFLNHRGQRLTRQGLWLIVKHYVRETGIVEEVTPHTLRHTFAAHLLHKKAELEYVQQILGHANISTTQVYTQSPGWDRAPEEGA